jgi:hypothetical protein
VASEHQVVEHREIVEQSDVLERPGEPEAGDLVRLLADDLVAEQLDPSDLGPVDARQTVQEGGLSGAVRSDDREQLPLTDVERHPVDGLDAGEPKRNLLHREDRCPFRQVDVCAGQRLGERPYDSHRFRLL